MKNKHSNNWGGSRPGAGPRVKKLFNRAAAALILDLEEAQRAGTPQEAQVYDRLVERAESTGLWTKIEKLGGIAKASEVAAEEYPDLL